MLSSRLVALDDYRALAISLVCLMHAYGAFWSGNKDLANPIEVIAASGGTGVNLFFVLSGLLVSWPFIQAYRSGGRINYAEYAAHRLFRILPPYYFIVLVGVWLCEAYEALPRALLFLVRGGEVGFFSSVWWSLAVEVQFYILLPILYFVFRYLGVRVFLLIIALWVFFYISWCADFFDVNVSNSIFVDSIIVKFPPFLFGFICACRLLMAHGNWSQRTRAWGGCYLFILLVFLWFVLRRRAEGSTGFSYEFAHPEMLFLESMIWAELVWVSVRMRFSLFGFAGRWLSKVSYSLYLVHMPIIISIYVYVGINELSSLWQRIFGLVMALSCSLLVAWVLYLIVELPFFRLRGFLFGRKSAVKLG